MKKLIAAVALVALMGCGEKKADPAPVAAPDAAAAPATTPDSAAAMPDSSMARDTSMSH